MAFRAAVGCFVLGLGVLGACTDLGGLSSGGGASDGGGSSSSTSSTSSSSGSSGDGGGSSSSGGGSSSGGVEGGTSDGAVVSCSGSMCTAPDLCCNSGVGLSCVSSGCAGLPVLACDDPSDCVGAGGACCISTLHFDAGATMTSTRCAPSCQQTACIKAGDCGGILRCTPFPALDVQLNYCTP